MRFELSGYAIDWEAVEVAAGLSAGVAVVLAGRRDEKVMLIFGSGPEGMDLSADPPRVTIDSARYRDFLDTLHHARAEGADVEIRVNSGPPAQVTVAAVF